MRPSKYVLNWKQNFSYFDPDYPTSGFTVTGLARVYCSSLDSSRSQIRQDLPPQNFYHSPRIIIFLAEGKEILILGSKQYLTNRNMKFYCPSWWFHHVWTQKKTIYMAHSESSWTGFIKSVFYVLSGISFSSPSKYIPADAMHLSHFRFHWLKHPWKSSWFKTLSKIVDLAVIVLYRSCNCIVLTATGHKPNCS
jgi:hypothetical protein